MNEQPQKDEPFFEIDEPDEADGDLEAMMSAQPHPETESETVPEQPRTTPTDDDELRAMRDKLLRVSADYENFKKRSAGNTQTSLEQQLISLARDLLPVLDHFDRAVEVDPDATTARDLLDGVNIVRDELMRMLSRYGIERIDAEAGEPFDPNRHEAMMRQPAEGVDSDHVAVQLQPGYALKDITIRPAGVTVAE